MKNLFQIGLLISLSFVLVSPANGQRLLKSLKEKAQERIEKKVEERVEEKVDEKIDEKIDEGLDKIEGSLEKDKAEDENSETNSKSNSEKSEQRMMRMLKGMGVTGEPIPIANSYQFDHQIQMHIESYDASEKKTSEGEFITLFNSSSNNMAYQVVSGDIGKSGQGMFIMDAENKATIILGEEDGKKTGLVYGIGSFVESMGENYDDDVDLNDTPESYLANPNIKKTGRTKTIAGYKCEEYTYSSDETDSESWITKDLKTNMQDFFSTLLKASIATNGMGWGYMMESTSRNKKTGEKSNMKVTKVDKNSNTRFSMNDYQITNFGNITIPNE